MELILCAVIFLGLMGLAFFRYIGKSKISSKTHPLVLDEVDCVEDDLEFMSMLTKDGEITFFNGRSVRIINK